MRLARMESDGPGTWSILVITDSGREVIQEKESYEVASQLTDAINARFGIPGPLSAVGRAVAGEIQEVADNVVRRYQENKEEVR